MKTFAQQRRRHVFFTVAAALILLFLVVELTQALRPTAIYTGFLLLGILLGLTLFNAKKKLPFLPLIRASVWLQIHIYAGFLSVVVFLYHTRCRLPTGRLETVLAILFGIVSVSGIFGIFISRALPRKITRSGEGLVYERIPSYRNLLIEKVEAFVHQAESSTGSSAIGDYYLTELAPYFRGKPSLLILLGDSFGIQSRMLRRMDGFSRYLSAKEKELMSGFRTFIEQKRNLDYQLSAQWLLKVWLFIHIPFTYGLLIAAFVHAWVALSFGGSF